MGEVSRLGRAAAELRPYYASQVTAVDRHGSLSDHGRAEAPSCLNLASTTTVATSHIQQLQKCNIKKTEMKHRTITVETSQITSCNITKYTPYHFNTNLCHGGHGDLVPGRGEGAATGNGGGGERLTDAGIRGGGQQLTPLAMRGTTTWCLATGRERQPETEVEENDSPLSESGAEVSNSHPWP
jgi:hypothetical protein